MNIEYRKVKNFLIEKNPISKGFCYNKDNLGCLAKKGEETPIDLSIIVPCYNVEKYVRVCIESILNQNTTYKFELILINDGSTDNTKYILNQYNKLQNVIIVEQENQGFSGARNTGLKYVQGKYLTFVDSDDILAENAINNWLNAAYKDDYDIVQGGYSYFNDSGSIYSIVSSKTHIINNPIINLTGFPWMKIIKSNLFKDLIFPEGYWFEDTIMKYLVYPRVKKAIEINTIVYKYRKNAYGITSTSKKSLKSIDSTWITELMLDNLNKFNITFNKDLYLETINQCLINIQRVFYLKKDIRQNICLYQKYILNKIPKHSVNNFNLEITYHLILNNMYNLLYLKCIFYKIYNRLRK